MARTEVAGKYDFVAGALFSRLHKEASGYSIVKRKSLALLSNATIHPEPL